MWLGYYRFDATAQGTPPYNVIGAWDEAPMLEGILYDNAVALNEVNDAIVLSSFVAGPGVICSAWYPGSRGGTAFNPRFWNPLGSDNIYQMPTTAFSLGGFVSTEINAAYQTIICRDYSFSILCENQRLLKLWINADGKLCCSIKTSTAPTTWVTLVSSVIVADGTYHHVGATWDYDESVLRLYVDGDVDTSLVTTGTLCASKNAGASTYVGRDSSVTETDWAPGQFRGSMACVFMASHQLSAGEMLEQYNIQFDSPNLRRSLFPMQDATGSGRLQDIAYDAKENTGNTLRVPASGFEIGATDNEKPYPVVNCLGTTSLDALYCHRPILSGFSMDFSIEFKPKSYCGKKIVSLEGARTGSTTILFYNLYMGTDGKVYLALPVLEPTTNFVYLSTSGAITLDKWHKAIMRVEIDPREYFDLPFTGTAYLLVDKVSCGSVTIEHNNGRIYAFWKVGGGSNASVWPAAAPGGGLFDGKVSNFHVLCTPELGIIEPPTRISSIMFSCNT